jgi:hypothetical protein
LKIYNFGTPPIGNKKFVEHYEGKLNLYRVVNEQDIVPKLKKSIYIRRSLTHFAEVKRVKDEKKNKN